MAPFAPLRRVSRPKIRAFTLIELLVVLAIGSIVSAITLGGFRSLGDSNKRTSCQSNLSQIYQSCRTYAQDYSGRFPYYNPQSTTVVPASVAPRGGIGLWALYTYPAPTDRDGLGGNDDLPLFTTSGVPQNSPLASYVRSPKVFHCPADNYVRNGRESAVLNLDDGVLSGQREINRNYLSYQVEDENGDWTYSTFRAADSGTTINRQLWNYTASSVTSGRPTDDKTIVAWCRFHRTLSNDGTVSYAGRRNFDNALFFDGSVQIIPKLQDRETPPCAECVTGWQRVPRPATP